VAKEKSTVFTVSAIGTGPRVLFYVKEDDNGETILTFNRGKRFRNAGSPGLPAIVARPEAEYLSSKVSIHASKRSEKLTLLHLNMRRDDGVWHNGYALTDAIKAGSSFSVLFYRRSSDMRTPSYAPKRPLKSYVSIGSYRPSAFELLFIVFVSAPSVPLRLPPIKRPYSLTSHKMSHVQISVLSTLLDLPSGPNGWTCWTETLPETDRHAAWHNSEQLAEMKKGYSAGDIVKLSDELFGRLRDESLETWRNTFGQLPPWTPYFFALNSTAAAERERELFEANMAKARETLTALGVKFDARGRAIQE
jgi:hypothetical protein